MPGFFKLLDQDSRGRIWAIATSSPVVRLHRRRGTDRADRDLGCGAGYFASSFRCHICGPSFPAPTPEFGGGAFGAIGFEFLGFLSSRDPHHLDGLSRLSNIALKRLSDQTFGRRAPASGPRASRLWETSLRPARPELTVPIMTRITPVACPASFIEVPRFNPR
jgi:hypothetical protein